MGWLSNLLFPCAQPRKPSRARSIRSYERPCPTPEEQRQKLSPIDTSTEFLPQKPNRLVKRPASSYRNSIRIVDYPDSDSMLDDFDEKYRSHTACADTESVLSDDRTIIMPGPEERAVLLEMSKIEKDLAGTPFSLPRRTSVTTTRTSACLDNILPLEAMSPIKEEVEESEEAQGTQDAAATSSSPEEAPKREVSLHDETTPKDQEEQQQQPQEHQPEQQQVQQAPQEPEKQPNPDRQSEILKQKQERYSQLSTRLSRRRSLIEIFNILHTRERSSFKLNLEFSPKLYQNPLSSRPTSSCSSSTAVSPPTSPVSTIGPLSPTLSDETIEFDGIETACAVQIAAPKGPDAIVRQGRDVVLGGNPFGLH